MLRNKFSESISISESNITFEEIYNKPYCPKEYIEEIKKANILIIPNENIYQNENPLFPETTEDFLDFIKDSAEDGIVVDIAVSDDNFKYLELHSAAVIEIATIIVKMVCLPIALNLISSFIYNLISKYHRNAEDTNARFKIISEETSTKKSKIIEYNGPVSEIKELQKIVEASFTEKNDHDS